MQDSNIKYDATSSVSIIVFGVATLRQGFFWETMPRRRELKGIARNFAEFLNGRNNDSQGYWANGRLCRIAQTNNTDVLVLNLKNSTNSLNSAELGTIGDSIMLSLDKMLETHKLPFSWIKGVNVEYRFNQEYQRKYHYWRSALGKPYLVKITIETDLSSIFSATEGGNVKPHDPEREQRRGGFE